MHMNWVKSVILVLSLALAPLLTAAELKVGDPAPDFSLQASDGKVYRMADFRGRQAVVIAWFPRAFTHGCTIECRSLARSGHLIRRYDVSYFMASVDPLEDNTRFAEQSGADFPLLSDPTGEVARAFGVLGGAGMANRHTVYIDRAGTVVRIDTAVRPETSAEDMAAALAELGVATR